MAEENTSQDAAQQTDEAQAKQDTTDWKAEARKWEQRAKENKAAADKLAAYEAEQNEKDEAEKSDLQRAIEKAEKASAELEAMKAEKKRADLIKATAKSIGVDEDLLSMMSGNTEDEIESNAQVLKAKLDAIPKYPNVHDGGEGGKPARPTKEDILKIKNKNERFKAIKQNADLFK